MQQFDVIVRVAGATLLIVASVALWRRGRRADHIWFAPFAICLCGYLAGNTTVEALQLGGVAGRIAVLLAGFTAVFLWWFCLSLFDWSFKPRGAVLALGLSWIVIATVDRGALGPGLAGRGLSWILIAIGFAIMGHLAWRLYRDRSGDLLDRRRQARLTVAASLAGLLVVDLIVDVVLGLDWSAQAYTIAQNLALLSFSAWLLSLMAGPRGRPAGQAVPEPSPMPSHMEDLGARLRQLVEVEKVHLDPDLDLATFVQRMGASERAVRRLINHQLGYDHFRTFLNAQRLAEARRMLADPARRGDKVIAIAMDSGFASLPSFNRVFQAAEGVPPNAYRRAALACPADAEDRLAVF